MATDIESLSHETPFVVMGLSSETFWTLIAPYLTSGLAGSLRRVRTGRDMVVG